MPDGDVKDPASDSDTDRELVAPDEADYLSTGLLEREPVTDMDVLRASMQEQGKVIAHLEQRVSALETERNNNDRVSRQWRRFRKFMAVWLQED